MANTLKKIQTITVGAGGTTSIDFQNIPQTYTDLKIVLSIRTDRAVVADALDFTFNNTTANRTYRELYGTGAAVVAGSSTGHLAGYINAATSTSSVFSNVEIYIPNYTSANNKSSTVDCVSEQNASTAYTHMIANLWSNSAAITRVTLFSAYSANIVQYSTATLYGVADVTAAQNAYATGGIITYDDTYIYHTFPFSGTFTPTRSLSVDYLVVAGGGGGGGDGQNTGGGAGGAGGLRCTVGATGGGGSLESQLAVTAQAYTVTVGAGGSAGSSRTNNGTNGSNSVFASITSTGGGKGGSSQGASGSSGGSGGGGNYTSPGTAGAGTANQGYAGGAGGAGDNRPGGGGGGANGTGATATSTAGGNGGNGVTTSISGTSTTYAGGGGGGTWNGGTRGTGGTGGGGNGGAVSGNNSGSAGTANRGGGGGGGSVQDSGQSNGGAGGSGIVIVRYAK